jgi:hypothetical protein
VKTEDRRPKYNEGDIKLNRDSYIHHIPRKD